MVSASVEHELSSIGNFHYLGRARRREVGVFPNTEQRPRAASYYLETDDASDVLAGVEVFVTLLHFVE
jgi:hypothetical protein